MTYTLRPAQLCDAKPISLIMKRLRYRGSPPPKRFLLEALSVSSLERLIDDETHTTVMDNSETIGAFLLALDQNTFHTYLPKSVLSWRPITSEDTSRYDLQNKGIVQDPFPEQCANWYDDAFTFVYYMAQDPLAPSANGLWQPLYHELGQMSKEKGQDRIYGAISIDPFNQGSFILHQRKLGARFFAIRTTEKGHVLLLGYMPLEKFLAGSQPSKQHTP